MLLKYRVLYTIGISLVMSTTNSFAISNIEHLLTEYNQKNKASSKTIDNNKGNLILFTREDIERMHATRLKDIFKTLPIVYYHENRYALPDPLSSGMSESYNSSYIRVYIDGVEVTQGWMGSGLIMYGDINIDFADHIEFYSISPSYESSAEPAYMTIYIYSKDPSIDDNTVMKLSQSSRGSNQQSLSYGDKVGDISYMINFAHVDAKREKIDNGTSTPLSRDFSENQFFTYIKDDSQVFHLQVIDKKTDSLAGASWDATPIESSMDYLNVHMDYSLRFTENWKMSIAYDWLKTRFDHEDDAPLMTAIAHGEKTLHGYSINDTLTAELTYNKNIDKHHLLAGIKGRYKYLKTIKLDKRVSSQPNFNAEKVFSVFAQDQYSFDEYSLLSAGISYTYIKRNAGISSDKLFQYRLGYIYNHDNIAYKAYIFKTAFALEPRIRDFITNDRVQTTYGLSSEFSYHTLFKRLRLGFIYMRDSDSLLQLGFNDVVEDTKYYISFLDTEYKFDIDNKISLQLYIANYNNISQYNTLSDISAYLNIFNRYKNIDFYNGFVFHANSLDWKQYIDWTFKVSWNINEKLSISLKGDNILGKAKKANIFRYDPSTHMLMKPLSISPVDRTFSINLEYRF